MPSFSASKSTMCPMIRLSCELPTPRIMQAGSLLVYTPYDSNFTLGMWASATSVTSLGANLSANMVWSAWAPALPIDLKDMEVMVPSRLAPNLAV